MTDASDMTIKAIRTTMLRVPWPDTPWLKGHAFGEARNILVLEVETKGGIVGMGYLLLFRPGMRTIAACLDEAIIPRVIGKDASAVEAIWQDLWRATVTYGRAGVVGRQARAWQQQVQGLLEVSEADGIAGSGRGQPPDTLRARLRPYQLDGFGWLVFLWQHRLGGILADDMGLGKTLEALALICHARQADPASAPFLVVAPTSVAPNWAAESARFAPGLKVVTITDTLARSGADLAEVIAGADVVVTSYTLLRLDFDAHLAAEWSGLILDEAQYVKNHQSKIYQCARRLRAPFKVAITGTPMENNLMELWSLLSITAPGLFPNPARFRDYYARPIERQGDAELLAQLRRRIRPLLKRRTKEQVAADLPEKQEQVLEVELHPRHRKLYQTYLQRERQKVLGLLDDINANRFTILTSLTRLRQLSLHAALVDSAQADLPCSKIDTLLDQIQDVAAGGHRALVFSQFTGFLAHVRERLDAGRRPVLLPGRQDAGPGRGAAALQGRHGPGVPDQPQGRRVRAEPDRGRLLLPARPVVEPGDRDAGDRPHPPDRADPQCHGVPPHRQGHDRGKGHGAEGAEGRAVRQRHRRRQCVRREPGRRRHPRAARLAANSLIKREFHLLVDRGRLSQSDHGNTAVSAGIRPPYPQAAR